MITEQAYTWQACGFFTKYQTERMPHPSWGLSANFKTGLGTEEDVKVAGPLYVTLRSTIRQELAPMRT
jgi:hypothetical protein